MRKSAIIRIIIWSIILALLVGFLALGLGYGSIRRARRELRGNSCVATEVPVPLTEATTSTAKMTIDVYSTPNEQSQIVGTIQLGEDVTIGRTETINGQPWDYVTSPVTGWVKLGVQDSPEDGESPVLSPLSPGSYTTKDTVNVRETPNAGSEITGVVKAGETAVVKEYKNIGGQQWACITSPAEGWIMTEYLNTPETQSIPADEVRKISVDWAAGEITIKAAEVEDISFYETKGSKHPMVWKLKDGKLNIEYCEDDVHFGLFSLEEKDLTILVPRDFTLEELELDTASTALRVSDLTIREVDVDSANGVCKFQNCNITDLDVDTASGDVFLDGTLNTLDFDAASAQFTGVLSNTPSRIMIDSMSGNLDLTLPEDTGFTVKMDGMRNDFTSDFPTSMRNGSQVCGDGRCLIEVEGMSSGVTIRRSGSLPVTEALPTESSEPKSLLPTTP